LRYRIYAAHYSELPENRAGDAEDLVRLLGTTRKDVPGEDFPAELSPPGAFP